jgi:hypothetical protein
MKLSSEDLQCIHLDSVVIGFSETDKNEAWKQTQTGYELNPVVRQNAYVNCLCLNLFLNYLSEELNIQISSSQTDMIFSFWQLVNGTAIDLEEARIILIPSENNLSELRVPREWLNLADWVGNYYLAVELNLEENWLLISGYATYQELHKNSNYDSIDETYTLEIEELIEDLSIMWTAREFLACGRPQLEQMPNLNAKEAELLLENFNQSIYSLPRLELPFARWEALLATKKWRQELLQQLQEIKTIERRQKAALKGTASHKGRRQKDHLLEDTNLPVNEARQIKDFDEGLKSISKDKANSKTLINLNQWLESTFVSGWQSLETVIDLEPKNLAFNFRKNSTTTSNFSVKGIKRLELDLKKIVAFLIELNLTASEKNSILVQLHPVGEQIHLPESIQIALIDPEGSILQQSVARKSDRFIQLKRFSCPSGQNFSLRVELDDCSWQEDFVI